MLEKIKHYQAKLPALVDRARDVRFVGQVLFVGIVLMVSWSGVRIIETNYRIQQQIGRLQQQNQLRELENQNIALRNEYYQSTQFLDIAARKNFGLASPGETVLSVPDETALRFTTDLAAASSKDRPEQKTPKPPTYQQNVQAWMDFFLHRQ